MEILEFSSRTAYYASVPMELEGKEPPLIGDLRKDALEVWDSLEKALCHHHSRNCGEELKEVPVLFADERTDNRVPLVLRRLRLGIDQVEPVSNTAFQEPLLQELSEIDELILAPYNQIPRLKHTLNSSQMESISDSSPAVTIHLSVIPTNHISSFSIQRIDAWLHSFGGQRQTTLGYNTTENEQSLCLRQPSQNPCVSTPKFMAPSRLSTVWKCWQKAQHQQHVNAYCSQIYQIIAQLENVGRLAIRELYWLVTSLNWSHLVNWTINFWDINPQDERCFQREAVWTRQNLRLRLAFRASPQPSSSPCQLSFLFFYIAENGASRQFSVLDSDQSLNYCLYIHHQQPSSSSSQLWLTDSPPDIPHWSHLISPEEFFLPEISSKGPHPEVHQSLAEMDVNQSRTSSLAHLRLAVLWKANIANSNGTVATVFGENILANPFGDCNEVKGLCKVPGDQQRPNIYQLDQTNSKEAQVQCPQFLASRKHCSKSDWLYAVYMEINGWYKGLVLVEGFYGSFDLCFVHSFTSTLNYIVNFIVAVNFLLAHSHTSSSRSSASVCTDSSSSKAKQEAQAEIEKYRQEREKHFKDYEQQYLGTKEDIEQGIKKETETSLMHMQQNVAAHKQEVIVRLLQLVCDIRPELHHNLTLQTRLQKEGKLGNC
uniref:V-type proton ATPase subunit G n=1 Tax=Ditylenchus dipsaci TaxID=166011 RepID=A0A915DXT4_9BILA